MESQHALDSFDFRALFAKNRHPLFRSVL